MKLEIIVTPISDTQAEVTMHVDDKPVRTRNNRIVKGVVECNVPVCQRITVELWQNEEEE